MFLETRPSCVGHALLSFATVYPLLGARGKRMLITIHGDLLTDWNITITLARDIQDACVPPAAGEQSTVITKYPEQHLDLAHSSLLRDG